MDGRTLPQVELLILQSTAFCNINCSYCYLPNRTDRRRMSAEVLEASFRQVLQSPFVQDRLAIVWHAGEPLTVPVAWYRRAFALADAARPPDLYLEHHFQTNGLLIDPDWIELFREPNVRVGLSIDGPADIHNARRRTRAGRGTFEGVMRGVARLHAASIPFHVISVISQSTLDHADRLYDFYVENGICNVAFNIDEQDGTAARSSLAEPGQRERFRAFLDRFFARMAAEPGRLHLREASDMLGVIRARGLHGRRAQDADPLRIVSIGVDGQVSSFSPELLGTQDERYGNFIFGSVLTDSLASVHGRIESSAMLADIKAGIEACSKTCLYFDYCGGGSPCNKLGETSQLRATETVFCRLMRQDLLEATLRMVETMAAQTKPEGVGAV